MSHAKAERLARATLALAEPLIRPTRIPARTRTAASTPTDTWNGSSRSRPNSSGCSSPRGASRPSRRYRRNRPGRRRS
jgi:hypothetical protein